MAVYSSPWIARGSDKPQIVILGSSNGQIFLQAKYLSNHILSTPIHSLAFPRQTIGEMDRLIDLLYRQTPSHDWQNFVFVLGISPSVLLKEKRKLSDTKTDLDIELMRYRIFQDSKNEIKPNVPNYFLSSALQFIWPFMMQRQSLDLAIKTFLPEKFWFGVAKPWHLTDYKSNTMKVNDAQRKRMIYYVQNYMAPIADNDNRGFEQLVNLAERISVAGGHLILVDLPTAKWLSRAVPVYDYYKQQTPAYIARLEKLKNVRYVNLQDGFLDDDFYDGSHPRARILEKVTSRVVIPINEALEELIKQQQNHRSTNYGTE